MTRRQLTSRFMSKNRLNIAATAGSGDAALLRARRISETERKANAICGSVPRTTNGATIVTQTDNMPQSLNIIVTKTHCMRDEVDELSTSNPDATNSCAA